MSEPAPDPALDALLDYLRRARGSDLSGYKRSSLERRLGRRMSTVGVTSYGDYLDYLEVHPDEFEALFDTLLINVTEFFRDPPVWEHLRREALPALLAGKAPTEPVRVWSAGCATGEEAYTIAMVLAEVLGVDEYRERVKIYATDIDEQALAAARLATYTHKDVEHLPEELRSRYFERADQRLVFCQDLRRTVIFGRNDLVQDAPISRLDLLVCRNTLMYFNAETQGRILRRFNFALAPHGLLLLGRSEMMVSHRDLFTPEDLKKRVFRRASAESLPAGLPDGERVEAQAAEDERLAREAALEAGPHPLLLVSRTGRLAAANLPARALFRLGHEAFNHPFAESQVATRLTGLAGALEQAQRERRRVTVGDVRYRLEHGEERRYDVTAAPLLSAANVALGVSVSFEDVTRYAALEEELETSRRELELACEELQSTIDELETTNEELQSANEELQTTNEQLESTNEELETMNEELQSNNEELETINAELRDRTGELNSVNEFLEAILTSLGVGIAVVDRQQRVQVWNRRAEDLWGLRRDDAVDRHFLSLDIGLPVDRLAPDLRAVMAGDGRRTAELEAVNRRGTPIVAEMTMLPLVGGDGYGDGDGTRVRGAIVLMADRGAADGAGS